MLLPYTLYAYCADQLTIISLALSINVKQCHLRSQDCKKLILLHFNLISQKIATQIL